MTFSNDVARLTALKNYAGLAQLAERDLAKVEVVSSNLIARSTLTDRI